MQKEMQKNSGICWLLNMADREKGKKGRKKSRGTENERTDEEREKEKPWHLLATKHGGQKQLDTPKSLKCKENKSLE